MTLSIVLIVVAHYVLPAWGLERETAARRQVRFSGTAGAAWLGALVVCGVLNIAFGVQVYFLALPGWLVAGFLYLLLEVRQQRRDTQLYPGEQEALNA